MSIEPIVAVANTGLRCDQRVSLSNGPAGRARIGSYSRMRLKSSANSSAVA